MPHDASNLKLLAHDELRGHGNIGEGVSLQVRPDGRRVLWLAHESAPTNFTGVDVTDPQKPKVVTQTELPHKLVRSNSLEVCGDILAVAYQTARQGGTPAGIELYDISSPEAPRGIGFFDCSGPHSRGVHQLWFVDGETIHFAGGAADFKPRDPKDDQFYRSIDVRDPTRPRELGRWWMPGTREGDPEPAPPRHPKFDSGFRAHNTNVYPERPDRAYVGFIDGGAWILDISDKTRPKPVGHWNPHPPYPGFTHTVMPLFDRGLLLVTDECVRDNGEDWPKLVWVLDGRREDNLVPISTFPIPPIERQRGFGGRYGAHNLHENRPGPAFRSDTIVFGTYFNGGLRVHDVSDPFQPREIAHFVPEAPRGSPVGSAQINDVYVDENEIVYAVDRFAGGLYVLEATL
ncbi:MAG TPA: hypothetical protein VMF53_13775 [Alphaproteobacteria bacterium]|nr:hypothetical protein [Alphaproteobacteria bacterium]